MGLIDGNDDKGVKDINEKIIKEETDKYLSDKMSSIKDSMSSIWSDSSSLWSQALDDPDKFLRQISGTDNNKDVWQNFVVNASDAVGSLFDVMGLPGGYGNPKRIRHLMDDPFTAEEVVKQGVTGLYNYRTPTDSQFSECQKVGGLSAWNTKGWWRCLFPESVVSERLGEDKTKLSNILTKEKIEADREHKFGLFFPEYTAYMNWRLHMNELLRQKNIEKQPTPVKDEDQILLTPEDLMLESTASPNEISKGKNVIGTSQFVTFNYTPEGQEEMKKVKTYFDNGTVLVKSEKKIVPKDGSSPKVETDEKLISSKDDKD